MHHPNRFVRETAHFTAATLCQALQGEGEGRLLAVGQDLAERLADGLSDNWSQVRSCVWSAAAAFKLCLLSWWLSVEWEGCRRSPMCCLVVCLHARLFLKLHMGCLSCVVSLCGWVAGLCAGAVRCVCCHPHLHAVCGS